MKKKMWSRPELCKVPEVETLDADVEPTDQMGLTTKGSCRMSPAWDTQDADRLFLAQL